MQIKVRHMTLFTDHIPKDAEGNVFTLFVSSQGGGGGLDDTLPLPSSTTTPPLPGLWSVRLLRSRRSSVLLEVVFFRNRVGHKFWVGTL